MFSLNKEMPGKEHERGRRNVRSGALNSGRKRTERDRQMGVGGVEGREQKSQKKPSVLIPIHPAELAKHPGCQAPGRKREAGSAFSGGRYYREWNRRQGDRGQREAKGKESGRGGKLDKNRRC